MQVKASKLYHYVILSPMTLSEELKWRGFINQSTFNDITQLDALPQWIFYHGFDASADSQTVGNLAGMMVDRVFMRHGHKAYLLAGGATSLIGDPGGKDMERPMQEESVISNNVAKAEKQLRQIHREHDFTLVNNLDWTRNLSALAFLRDIGKHFSMTPLVQRDYIAKRIGEGGIGISYTEFSYTLLQGMDFLHLYDNFGVTLQIGSSDQWGNCLSGVELIRRVRGKDVHVLTHPLIINKATGKKFGKSEEGAVWLDPQKTSPTQFYQFWVNTDDQRLEDYLKVFTEHDKEIIDRVVEEHTQSPKGRTGQNFLAYEVTKLVHSESEAKKAQLATNILTGKTSLLEADEEVIALFRSEMPYAKVGGEATIAEALVNSGLVASGSEANRVMGSGGVYVNNNVVSKANLDDGDFINGQLLLRRGKAFKDTALIEREN